MANEDDDGYFPLSKASPFIPGRPHRATLWRWALTGIVRYGRTIRLRTTVCGGRRFTTKADIKDFLSACNGDAPDVAAASKTDRAEAAARALESRGVG